MDEFEKAFQSITAVVLGRKLEGYGNYEAWLSRNVTTNEFAESVLGKERIYLPPFQFYRDIRHNLATIKEAYGTLGKKQLSFKELDGLSFSNAKQVLKNISTTTLDTQYGESSNIVDCSLYYYSHFCIKGCALNRSKYSLYSFWPRYSDYTLGCYYVFSSQFCIKCYSSENLVRCFELSDCNKCTDSLFCHNCENLVDCMFCFNVKTKRYAIANVEVGRERYMKIKKMVLDEIVKRLEKDKDMELSIYTLGNPRRKK
jgi:hypothetical protein